MNDSVRAIRLKFCMTASSLEQTATPDALLSQLTFRVRNQSVPFLAVSYVVDAWLAEMVDGFMAKITWGLPAYLKASEQKSQAKTGCSPRNTCASSY